jgi:hypothetical protein
MEADLNINSIKIVRRKRWDTSPIKPRSVLADTVCYPGDAVVNAETGFYTVVPGESVIFVSSDAEGKLDRPVYQWDSIYGIVLAGVHTVELVVLRGIAMSSEHSGVLYEWASGVVEQACYDRRDVRVCPAYFFTIIP